MLKFLAILIVVLGANAYVFLHPVYDEYLFDKLRSLNNDLSLSRHRRNVINDSSENKENGIVCCIGDKADPDFLKQLEQCNAELNITQKDFEIRDRCDYNAISRRNDILICSGECIYRAFNLIDDSYGFKREVIIKYFGEHIGGDTEWKKAVLDEYVDDCLTEVAATQKVNDKQCSNAPINLELCMVGKFLTGCPADLRINSGMCNNLREYIPSRRL